MKTGKKTAIIVSAVAVTALLCFVFLRKKEVPVELQTEKPHYGYISESVTATGTVQPVDTVAVGTQISGTIYKIYTDFNSNVKQGELLAELDPSLTKAALLEARANLAEAESNEAYQEKNYNRQNQLYAAGAISKADYDLALNSLNTTKASIRNAEGQVSAALKNLTFTKIYSPINGVVLNRNVSVGQTVAASFSTPTLFSIANDITHMQVRANVDEADIGNVKKGSRATFTVDAYQDNVFKGNVTEVRLQPTVSANVVTYTTLINAENPDKKLKPGMTANVTIYTRESDSALLIPVKATRFKPDSVDMKKYKIEPLPRTRDQQINVRNKDSATAANYDRAYVWLLQEDKIVQRKIKTGLNNSINVQVLAGLTPSDLVLTGTADHEPGKASVNGASPFMPARRSPSRGGPGR